MKRRATIAAAVLAVALVATGIALIVLARQADSAYFAWEFRQTLAGAYPSDPPTAGVVYRIGAWVSFGLAGVSGIVWWVTDGG